MDAEKPVIGLRNVKLTLAYDGTAYAGWQYQPDRLSVQEVLSRAIGSVTGVETRPLASGRTDAGVHALRQVAGFRTACRLPADVLRRTLNANLPRDVVVLEVEDVSPAFHPIRDVLRKRYCYLLGDAPQRDVFRRHYCWQVGTPLDAAAMQRAAIPLVGTHDFASFQTAGAPRATTVRTIYELLVRRGGVCFDFLPEGLAPRDSAHGADLLSPAQRMNPAAATGAVNPALGARICDEPGSLAAPASIIVLEIEADGFLYNMVRAIVGTLVEVGRGARSETWPDEVLAACDRRRAAATAPPQGLFLAAVTYGESKKCDR